MRRSFLLLSCLVALWASSAHAQTEPQGRIRANGTSIPGMGLIGLEAAASVSTAFGLRNPYWLAGVSAAGLAGGIVGGVFANRIQGPILHDVVGVSSLVIGMGGILPATLLVLQIRSREPEEKAKDDKKKEQAALPPPALFQVREGNFALSAPAPAPLSALPGDAPVGAALFSGTF